MTSIVTHTGFTVGAIDVFAGFGGSSQGIVRAGADLLAAANHNLVSLECHAANFREVEHLLADMVDPNNPEVIDRRGRKIAGRYLDPADLPAALFCWWSPSCTDHTQSNATKLYARGPQGLLFDEEDFDYEQFLKSERSRATMSCVLRYARRHRPELITVENVVEVCHWGPDRDGTTFKWWLRELKNLGYEVEFCFFNSMFFAPCPQSRDRIYIVGWRKGNKAPDLDYRPVAYCTSDVCAGRHVNAVQTWKPRTKAWPLPKWGKYRRQYIYTCPDCRCEVEPAAWPALTAIDWSHLGTPIGERAERKMKALEPATIERVRRGLAKFRHIVIPVGASGAWSPSHGALSPFTTQTTRQDKALITGGIVAQRANTNVAPPLGSVNSLTAHADLSLVSAGTVAQRMG